MFALADIYILQDWTINLDKGLRSLSALLVKPVANYCRGGGDFASLESFFFFFFNLAGSKLRLQMSASPASLHLICIKCSKVRFDARLF